MKNEDINEFVESVAKVKYDKNSTVGFELVKLKDRSHVCQMGCGNIVTNQVIERKRAFTPQPHWRTHCKNCQAFLHPDGVNIVKGSHKIQSIFMAYFNERNK